MLVYDLELNQGDTQEVGMLLKDKGVGVDLTGSTVTFSMKNEVGSEFDIACGQGGTVNGQFYTFAQGGITVTFTTAHTGAADVFQGKVCAVKGTLQKTFPDKNKYITVKVWEAIKQ